MARPVVTFAIPDGIGATASVEGSRSADRVKASITEPESAYKVRLGYSIRTEDSIFNFPGWDLFPVIYVRISFALHSHRGHPGPIYLLRLLPGMLCRVSVAVFCFRRYSAAFFVLCSAQKRRVILPFYIFSAWRTADRRTPSFINSHTYAYVYVF